MEKPKKRQKYYIQPADLKVEIEDYQRQLKENPDTAEASETLGKMLVQIATGLAASSRFDRHPCRDDMTGDAIVRMYKNLHLIDTTDADDLPALAQRDFNKSSEILYSKTPINRDPECKDTSRKYDCKIFEYDPLFGYCTIKLFKKEKVVKIDDKGKKHVEEEYTFTKTIKKVPLENLVYKKINPFSYLTMICYRVYISRTFKETKQRKALDVYKEEVYSEFECAECISNRNPSEGDMDLGFDDTAIAE